MMVDDAVFSDVNDDNYNIQTNQNKIRDVNIISLFEPFPTFSVTRKLPV